MINVHVSYTVKPEFVEQNKKNIALFLEDFKILKADFRYEVFMVENTTTFVHASSYKNEDVQNRVLNLPSFLAFKKARDESGLNGSHKVQILELIDSYPT